MLLLNLLAAPMSPVPVPKMKQCQRLMSPVPRRLTWVLTALAEGKLLKGKTLGIDATTLEANAAMRSIIRNDSGESSE